MPLYVLGLSMRADRTDLLRGQSTRIHVTLSGLESLPAAAWQPALPPADLVDLRRLQQRLPGFTLPTPSDRGMVLLVLENRSPAVIRMGKRGDRIALQVRQRDVAKGPFTYEDKLQSLQSGGFQIRGSVAAFLQPVVAR